MDIRVEINNLNHKAYVISKDDVDIDELDDCFELMKKDIKREAGLDIHTIINKVKVLEYTLRAGGIKKIDTVILGQEAFDVLKDFFYSSSNCIVTRSFFDSYTLMGIPVRIADVDDWYVGVQVGAND